MATFLLKVYICLNDLVLFLMVMQINQCTVGPCQSPSGKVQPYIWKFNWSAQFWTVLSYTVKIPELCRLIDVRFGFDLLCLDIQHLCNKKSCKSLKIPPGIFLGFALKPHIQTFQYFNCYGFTGDVSIKSPCFLLFSGILPCTPELKQCIAF